MVWTQNDHRTYTNAELGIAVAEHFQGGWFIVTQSGGHVDATYENAQEAMRVAEQNLVIHADYR